jgi:hypothetical protein
MKRHLWRRGAADRQGVDQLKKASRNNDAGNASAHGSNPHHWDFAIAWGRGRHVTVFPPPGWILVCGAVMLVAAALVAAIWFL